ncbi:unnamed protein product, partial [Orchesella dallaii]
MVRLNENDNVENIENMPPGELTFPFKQDYRYSMNTEVEDRRIHLGEAFELQLSENFLDYEKFQEAEEFHPYDLRAVTDDENQRLNLLMLEEKEVQKRQIIRRHFPLRVTVVSGVMYSPWLKVILESFKKIREFKQTKIDPVMVYSNYVQVPRRLRVQREALRDAMYMNAQPMDEDEDDVEVFQDPIPIPQRPASARGGSHQERDAHEREPSQVTSRNTQEEFRTPYEGKKRTYAEVLKTPRKDNTTKLFRGMHSKSARRLDFDNVLGDPPKRELTYFSNGLNPIQWECVSIGIIRIQEVLRRQKIQFLQQ